MAKKRAVKPKIVDGVHVNFEECKQAFRIVVSALREQMPWAKAYTNKRKDGIQWKLWCLWNASGAKEAWPKTLTKLFKLYFPFSTDKIRKSTTRLGFCLGWRSARAWTHKSDFDRRAY